MAEIALMGASPSLARARLQMLSAVGVVAGGAVFIVCMEWSCLQYGTESHIAGNKATIKCCLAAACQKW